MDEQAQAQQAAGDSDPLRHFRESWKSELKRRRDGDAGPAEAAEQQPRTATAAAGSSASAAGKGSGEAGVHAHARGAWDSSQFRLTKRARRTGTATVTVEQEMAAAAAAPTDQADANDSLVDLLIADLVDDVSDIPFFDYVLPREVALNIFGRLTYIELCRCAQVSAPWRALADDYMLWFYRATALGFAVPGETPRGVEWKERVRERLERYRRVRGNWVELRAEFKEVMTEAQRRIGTLGLSSMSGTTVVAVQRLPSSLVTLWDVASPSASLAKKRFNLHGAGAGAGLDCIDHHGPVLAAASEERVWVWHTSDAEPVAVFDHPASPLLSSTRPSVAVSPFAAQVLSARQASLSLFDAESSGEWARLWHVAGLEHPVQQCVPLSKPAFLAMSTQTLEARAFATGHVVATYHGQILGSACTAVACHEETVSLASSDATMQRLSTYSLETQQALQACDVTRLRPWTLQCLSRDLVLAAGRDNLSTFDMRTGERAEHYRSFAGRVTINAVQAEDWKILVGAGRSKTHVLALLDRRTGKKLWEVQLPERIASLAIHDDRLLVSSQGARLDLRHQQLAFHEATHTGAISLFDFSLDNPADDSNPFSSTWNDIAGYSFNLELETPFDNAEPFRLG